MILDIVHILTRRANFGVCQSGFPVGPKLKDGMFNYRGELQDGLGSMKFRSRRKVGLGRFHT